MDITITLSNTELSNADKALIIDSLGIIATDIDTALTKLCKTAFMEYIKMFKEKGLPTRADEVQQERLFFLLNHYFVTRLPSENEISSIFQLTTSQSKTLLRNTKSRYRTKIKTSLKSTLLLALNSARQQPSNGPYEFVCTSSSTVEELNSIISQKGPELKPIEKVRGLSNKYSCEVDTYNLLINHLR